MGMIYVPCNICGDAGQLQSLWTVPDRHWAPDACFNLVACERFGAFNRSKDTEKVESFWMSDVETADFWRL